MKIGIFTGRTISPLHPRIESIIGYLKREGISFEIIPPLKRSFFSRINWFSLWFFDNHSIRSHRKKIKLYDVVFIQDLKYLPLAKAAKRNNKFVIYETLDNNVALRLYDLKKKLPVLKPFSNCINKFFTSYEKKYASKYCDKVIVNSKALREYFENKAELIYYCSSFEILKECNNEQKLPALIYLGEFSVEKGADDVLRISTQFQIPLFIFGTIRSNNHKIAINSNSLVKHTDRISHKELTLQLENLLRNYFLIGTSFIKPVHFSYATQEANKDIDYLSMGIPIIGNHRLPTEEKILAGCGVFLEDNIKIEQLISDQKFRSVLSKRCKEYYNTYYSISEFETKIDNAFRLIRNHKND